MPSGLPRHVHPAAHPAVGPFVFDAFATSTGSRFHSFDSWHRWELEMRNPKMPPRTIEWPKLLDDGDPTPSFHEALTGFLPVLGVMLESSYVFLAYNSKLFDLPIYIIYPQNFGNTCLFQDLPIGNWGEHGDRPNDLSQSDLLTILSP